MRPNKFATVACAVVALAAAQRTAVTIPPNAQLTRLLSVPSPDDESSRMLRVGDEEDDICHPITRWEHLPPLPEPKRCEMRMEASGGTVLVLALVAVFTGMTQGVALGPGKLTGAWWWLFFCLIYGEAACAIGCLLGIMWGDPGVVKRSEETCFPIPAEVADRLRRGLSLEQMGNVTEDGRTYCIRCLLWRPGGLAGRSTVHHCGTCQRCSPPSLICCSPRQPRGCPWRSSYGVLGCARPQPRRALLWRSSPPWRRSRPRWHG